MSLSQKHAGKILVPWFNVDEWKTVKGFIYSPEKELQQKAVDVMKIWKLRTPLLSVGVEGTLILLEALLADTSNLNEFEISHIYSTAILRFLNICAACNERQGTFYNTARQNDLPRWLVTLRHDIAHSHKVPSLFMLELALKECLTWIKPKYWDVQEQYMKDFEAGGKLENPHTYDVIYCYLHLSLQSFYDKVDFNYELRQHLAEIIENYQKCSVESILQGLGKHMKEQIKKHDWRKASNYIMNILVEDKVLLSIKPEVENGVKKIPVQFKKQWIDLLNILYDNDILIDLLHKLHGFTRNFLNEDDSKQVASIWIREIVDALNKTKLIKEKLENIQLETSENLDSKTAAIVLNSIHKDSEEDFAFKNIQNLPVNKMQNFLLDVFAEPDIYWLEYIKSVLKFNNWNSEDITNVESLTEKCTTLTDIPMSAEEMIGDILNNTPTDDKIEPESPCKQLDAFVSELLKENNKQRRWKKVTDSSIFKGCPLGILNSQKLGNQRNPILF